MTQRELLSWQAPAVGLLTVRLKKWLKTSDEENVSRCADFRVYSSDSVTSATVANLLFRWLVSNISLSDF